MDTETTFYRLNAQNAHWLDGSDVFDNVVDPAQVKSFVNDRGHELVFAVNENRVVGFASGTVLLHPDKPPSFFVNEVEVIPNYRRRGIGASLCEQLFAIARSLECEGIWLATEEGNIAARALYSRLDARETLKIVVYDWDGAMDG